MNTKYVIAIQFNTISNLKKYIQMILTRIHICEPVKWN